MPAPRTPSNILDLTGRIAHDKKRLAGRQDVVDPTPIGSAPPDARIITYEEAWAAILSMCPEGVLRQRDTAAVAEAARCWMNHCNLMAMHRMQGCPLAYVDNGSQRQFTVAMAKLGLSPTDATHVTVFKPTVPDSDFE
jgi:hypothetical protein